MALVPTPRLDRRALLGVAGAATAALVLPGCSSGFIDPAPDGPGSCLPRNALDSHATLGKRRFIYEPSERRESFAFDPGFYARLGSWFDSYQQHSQLPAVDQVWSYGAWRSDAAGCSSWHNVGRAVDLARLRLSGGGFVSCRYDSWRSLTGAKLERARRRYWGLAASLHLDFAHVLTYAYNEQHFNHIHVDNGRSGADRSTFSTRSQAQLQAVQAICTHLWDSPVEITGRWDSATQRATRAVLDRLEEPADLNDSVDSWRAFLTASIGRGGG